MRDVRPLELDSARSRLEKTDDAPRERRLAAPGFADNAERLAASNCEGDLIHSLHRSDLAA